MQNTLAKEEICEFPQVHILRHKVEGNKVCSIYNYLRKFF